jgi:NADPH2:quinone reductase
MAKVKAIRFSQTGGPEVLHLEDVDLPPPGKGEVTISHAAIGLNYIDTYHRSGLYPVSLPSGIGLEASGTVEAVGDGVTGFKPGDRVAYGTGTVGAYSQKRNYPANRLVKIPDSIGDEAAAAMMLKGMTARYLLRATYKVEPGDVILFHAAAGGVGLIAVQWAKALGATVIGTVGSPEKAELARAHGCDHVIDYRKEDVAKQVREITGGVGVPVVYDGVGAATVTASLDSLRVRGLLVSFGNASGPVRNFDLGLLSAKGSLYVTRPTLFAYVATDAEFRETAEDLVAIVASGKVKIEVNQRHPLADAATAHRELESRKTTGSTILLP